jgi:glutamate--cysteine ligase
MEWNFNDLSKQFSKDDKHSLLAQGNFGIELESQRITPSGDLALTPHPSVFGDKAENPYITTDFSESQIEMITPPLKSVEETYKSLEEIYAEVKKGIKGELLWPFSMPPKLPDEAHIPIASFSASEEGREREIYRNGLVLRYGKKMQMISGIHYNFSFSENMIDYLYGLFGNGKTKRIFTDDMYFALTRNFLRYRWMLIYLLGASPSYDSTYYSVISKELKIVQSCCPECCDPTQKINQFATSLRVSRFGYSNTLQRRHKVYFNSLEEYSAKLKKMMTKASLKYLKLGLYKNGVQVQLNGNVLQKESEFYSSIRLKQIALKGETQLDALAKRGVKYLEVRILDINPFEKLGMSLNQLHFLQVFMLYCLFEQSNNITSDELKKINANHHLVALYGRKKDLLLKSYEGEAITVKDFGKRIFEKLRYIAKLMDKDTKDIKYQKSVSEEYQKLMDISQLPSERIFREMQENHEDFLEFGTRQAIINSQINSQEDCDYDNEELYLRRA